MLKINNIYYSLGWGYVTGDGLRQSNKSIEIRLLPNKFQRDCNQLGVFQGNIVSELVLRLWQLGRCTACPSRKSWSANYRDDVPSFTRN